MPDIMMCDAEECPKARQCCRHQASGTKPSQPMQSWWLRDADSPLGDDCDNFWRVDASVKAAHHGSMP